MVSTRFFPLKTSPLVLLFSPKKHPFPPVGFSYSSTPTTLSLSLVISPPKRLSLLSIFAQSLKSADPPSFSLTVPSSVFLLCFPFPISFYPFPCSSLNKSPFSTTTMARWPYVPCNPPGSRPPLPCPALPSPKRGGKKKKQNFWSIKGSTNMPLFGRVHECKEIWTLEWKKSVNSEWNEVNSTEEKERPLKVHM